MQLPIIDQSESENIKVRKKISDMFSEARKEAKPTTCRLCGKKATSFCNSHSVPQLSLRSIADSGKVLQATALSGMQAVDIEKGVKNSGTFQYICNDCDNSFFQDYENKQNLINYPTDKMLGEIAVKNFLLELHKREVQKALLVNMQKQQRSFENFNQLSELFSLDERDYNEEIEFHKNIVEQNITGGYQILLWKVLPYKIPIAVQSAVALTLDLEGNMINDVYDYSRKNRIQFLHIAIFPLENESILLAFYHKRDKKYRKLRHQFNCISEDKQIEFINYLIFAYTENFFISKKIQLDIEKNPKLTSLSKELYQTPDFGMLSLENLYGKDYSPVTMSEIPNFLSKEWAVV